MPYTKDKIKNAPNIDDAGHLSEAEEQDLYQHYNVAYTTEGSTFADTSGTARTTEHTETGETTESNQRAITGHDTSGETTDAAMTRSEEKLNVGTERVQAGKARLRKYIETENVQVDVPIRTEKAVLVTEPVTDANRGDAYDGPDISEEEHEVVLNTERPVVSKETVAKERVRLDTEVEESTQTVSDESARNASTSTATSTTPDRASTSAEPVLNPADSRRSRSRPDHRRGHPGACGARPRVISTIRTGKGN